MKNKENLKSINDICEFTLNEITRIIIFEQIVLDYLNKKIANYNQFYKFTEYLKNQKIETLIKILYNDYINKLELINILKTCNKKNR